MAESKKVLSTDVIDDDLFVKQIENAKLFEAEIDKIVKGLNAVKKESANSLKANKDPKSSKDIKQATKDLKDLKQAEEAIIKLEEKKNKVKEQSLKLTDEQIKDAYIQKQIAKDRKAELEALALIESRLIGTEQKLLAQNTLLRLERKKLIETDKDYASKLADINAKIDANNKKISENSDKLKQNSMNVGNYTESVKDAINQSELMNKTFGSLNESNQILVSGFQAFAGKLDTVKEAIKGADTSSKKLGLTLKGLGIGLIISAIASLGALFTSSRNGANDFRIILAKLSATISVIVGNLSTAGSSILGFGTAIKQVFSGDFSGALETVTKSLNGISTAFDGTQKRIDEQIDATVKLTEETIKYEDALRKLQLTQLKLNLDEEDYNEILADETRTITERNKALDQAIKKRKASAEIGVQIANEEKRLAFERTLISLRNLKVSDEEIERLRKKGAESLLTNDIIKKADSEAIDLLNEKVKASIEADDKLSDLPRQESQRQRKLVQDQQSSSIELILKKKLNAQEEIAILNKQVADEKTVLSERAVFINQLRQKELESTQAVIDKFNQKIDEENKLNKKGDADLKQRVDFQDLINTKDAVALGEKIKLLKVSESQQELVAKIVADAQTNEIANDERIKKQKQDIIALKEREQKIDFGILQIQKQTELDILKDLENSKLKQLEEYNTQVLQQENVFNQELLKLRKQSYDDAELLREEEFKQRQEDFERKAEQAKIDAEQNIVEPTELAKKKKEIEVQLNRDLKQLEIEKQNATIEANKKELEQLRAIEIKKTEIVLKDLQTVTQNLSQELDNRNQLRNDNAQKEIDKNKSQIDKQRALAEKGSANQLAFEESQLAKRELQQQQALEKQARQKELIQLGEAYLSAFNARLTEVGGDPNTAPIRALGDVLLAKGISKGLVQFAKEGNEMVMPLGVGGKDGVDDIPFMLTKHEAVIPKDANLKHHDAVKSLIDGSFDKVFRPVGDNGTVVYRDVISSKLLNEQNKTNKLLQELVSKPVQQVDVDSLGNIRESIIKETQKVVITHKKRSRI